MRRWDASVCFPHSVPGIPSMPPFHLWWPLASNGSTHLPAQAEAVDGEQPWKPAYLGGTGSANALSKLLHSHAQDKDIIANLRERVASLEHQLAVKDEQLIKLQRPLDAAKVRKIARA